MNPDARVSLLCHSYGSVVCGAVSAADGMVADTAVYGSPGMGIASADELGSSARLWAGMGGSDPIAAVSNDEIAVLRATIGFGADPLAPGFGAHPFPAGDGGHSDYYEPGAALRSLALIALGRDAEVWGG